MGDKAVSAYAEAETAVSKVNAYFGEIGEAAEAVIMVKKNLHCFKTQKTMREILLGHLLSI